ncbi:MULTISPECIES: hypothetical protein [unclassified Bradyrhizobium]|uniref:hypothetical protein n=1 Tax=unclassified Bradyrhizobium TaxID=2631580 RepID=UPI0028E460B0|nr:MULTISPECIES: hypothetical protein [unclassified Bradyrhizobium]
MTAMSAAEADPETIASAVASKAHFFMTIPITLFRKSLPHIGPPGRKQDRLRHPDAICARVSPQVKQKSAASAAFLGVLTIPRQVVSACCI